MRTKILILILLVCGITRAAAVNYDANGHVLTREWALYREAMEQDRPKDALDVLERIISVAQKERYTVDFADAWNARVSIASSRDWRQRDSLRRAQEKAFADYDDPILEYAVNDFIRLSADLPLQRERLKEGHNRGFYHKLPFISNDYEYVLWRKLLRNRSILAQTDSELYNECRQVFGPAVELLREDYMLGRRLQSLSKDCKGGDDTPARALYEDCRNLELRISALRSTDRKLASALEEYKSVASKLTECSVDISSDGDSILVLFRNQKSTTLRLVKGRQTLRRWTVQKPGDRFYVTDTAKIALPVIKDGQYELHFISDENAKGQDCSCGFGQYSLSLYCQKGPEFFHYVADAVTGRPVENYVLSWSEDSLRVSASSQRRLSDNLYIHRRPRPLRTTYMYEDFIKAEMFTDKKAYRRGESVEVKALLYKGSTTATAHIMPEGTEVQFVFRDREGKLLKECGTALSKAGTACASFALPDDIRGGYLSIDVNVDGNLCGSDYVQVDDFVLAEFNCEFDQIRELYFPGDTVTVTGRVYAMDGGRADVVSATYSIASDSRSSSETKPLDVAQDGSFSIRVPSTNQGNWWSGSVMACFRLSSGEIREFTKNIFCPNRCGLNVEPAIPKHYNSFYCYSGDQAGLKLEMTNADGCPQSVEVSYSLAKDGAAVCEGTAITGHELTVPLNKGEGNYRLTLIPQCRNCDTTIVDIVRYTPGASSLDADVENIFMPVEDEDICFDFGSTRGPVWAVALVIDSDGHILARRDIFLEGRRACEGSFKRITIPYEAAFPDNVAMKLFYFKNNIYHEFEHQFKRPTGTKTLDIRWNRMEDSTTVGAEYTVSFNAPGSMEAAVSVFDKSTEFIAENRWSQIPLATEDVYHPDDWIACGCFMIYNYTLYDYVAEEAIPFQLKSGRADANGMPDSSEAGPRLRSDFATTLCWAPRLEPDENGRYSVKFRTSDKTGTFVVNAFAHDASVRSAADRRTFTVSLPVKVDVLRPTILTDGDRYDLRAVVSSLRINNIGINVKGLVKISSDACDIAGEMPVSVAADSSAVAVFPIEVPAGITELPLTVTFLAEDGRYSDAIALSIPVRPAVQRLTEAHSAVLRRGDRGDAVLDSLRSAFVNTSSYGAEYKEIAVRDMLAQCIAGKHDSAFNGAKHGNAISLSAAICTELVYASMDRSAVKDTTGLRETLKAASSELASFQYSDGGLAWIKGMRSNAIVTCAVLERLALTRDALGLFDRSFAERAMAYLDRCAVAQSVNTGQYLYVRSLYADIPFAAKADKKFSKRVRDFLLPKNERGLDGMIYDKMLRVNTLAALKGGSDLLGAWGVNCTDKDLDKSIQADVLSLSQYAVPAGHGAVFYPNLVMPYRGLLASEAYAHTLLCRALQPWRPDLSDGIRLWLMLQKETQHWDSGFEFVNVVSELLGAGDAVLDTRIATLSQSYEKPISEIKAAGNGMTLKCSYERKADGKILGTYRISSENNRSFVCLTVPRFGCLMPADQISHFTRYGVYREVLHDRTLYWFEVLPEHVTTITEEFFVTQDGSFNAPVPTIECLYAPHYFANTQYIIL